MKCLESMVFSLVSPQKMDSFLHSILTAFGYGQLESSAMIEPRTPAMGLIRFNKKAPGLKLSPKFKASTSACKLNGDGGSESGGLIHSEMEQSLCFFHLFSF